MDKQEIFAHLREQQHWISQRREEEWLGIFHFGSYNYGLFDEYSDIDSRYIVFSKEPIKEYSYKQEHIEVVSFDTFVWGLTDGQLTFLETLFTNYYFVNPKYIEEWKQLRSYLHILIKNQRYKIGQSLLFCASQSIEKYEKNISEDPLFYVYGYPPKTLSHLKRYIIYADYLLDKKTENFFIVPDKDYHLFLKRGGLPTREQADPIVQKDYTTLKKKINQIPIDANQLPAEFFWLISQIYQKENKDE